MNFLSSTRANQCALDEERTDFDQHNPDDEETTFGDAGDNEGHVERAAGDKNDISEPEDHGEVQNEPEGRNEGHNEPEGCNEGHNEPEGRGVEVGAQMERVPVNLDELADLAILPNMTTTMQFILALQSALLDDPVAKLNEDAKQDLCNPPHEPPDIIDPVVCHAIRIYYALEHSSQIAYQHIRASTMQTYPDAEAMPSFCCIVNPKF